MVMKTQSFDGVEVARVMQRVEMTLPARHIHYEINYQLTGLLTRSKRIYFRVE